MNIDGNIVEMPPIIAKKEKWYRSTFVKKFLKNKLAVLGLGIVCFTIIVAIFAPIIANHDPLESVLTNRLKAPNKDYFFGTDGYGRDVFSRIVYGTRASILVGACSIIFAAVVGTIVGVFSGYFGGVIEMATMRLNDIALSFPGILLALVVVATFGSNMMNIIIALGMAYTPRFALFIRGVVLTIRNLPYIEAEKALGATHWRIMNKHILPNIFPSILILSSLNASTAIIAESTLSYLGLGIQPPSPTLGSIIADGNQYLINAPWISIFSGCTIMLFILGLNLFGDALRDILDPKMKDRL